MCVCVCHCVCVCAVCEQVGMLLATCQLSALALAKSSIILYWSKLKKLKWVSIRKSTMAPGLILHQAS